MTIRLFLFDLDGTLVDTAPDLALAVNMVRTARGIAPLPEEELRPYASRGAPGLLGKAMGIGRDDPAFLALRTEFLDNYAAHMTDRSRPFEGVPVMLEALRAAGIRTGVVTNKVEHLALRLTDNLGLDGQLDVVLGSDSEGCAMKPAPDSRAFTSRTSSTQATTRETWQRRMRRACPARPAPGAMQSRRPKAGVRILLHIRPPNSRHGPCSSTLMRYNGHPSYRGRLGFDGDADAAWGMSRCSHLVNPLQTIKRQQQAFRSRCLMRDAAPVCLWAGSSNRQQYHLTESRMCGRHRRASEIKVTGWMPARRSAGHPVRFKSCG